MRKKQQISGAEALLNVLLEEGVDTVFGYPGGAIMPLYDKLYDYTKRLKHILVRHEQGAVHAAEGYARASGRVGVCLATAGPGATNLVTGIADALMDSTPIVCITAQVAKDNIGTNFFQEADTLGITNSITKWSYEITCADEVAQATSKAFYIARMGRPGPVLISITRNAQLELTDYHYSQFEPKDSKASQKGYREEDIEAAALLVNSAQRPMIIVGQGILISGAEKEVRQFAEGGNIPVTSTLLGISAFPTGHPLFRGNVGMHGNYAPNKMTQYADLIVAVGMRFSDRVTSDPTLYAPKARIVHIEIDRAEINKTVHADIPLVGDAKEILQRLVPKVSFKKRGAWFRFIGNHQKEEQRIVTAQVLSKKENSIRMGAVVNAVAEISKGEAIIVTDVGQHQMFAALYSKFTRSRGMITSGGLGTMGFGLPAAIGAKVAMGEREVILFAGDGGIQMSLQELGTIMQSDIAVKIIILHNEYLGMVRQWQEMFFNHRYSHTHMINPDFTKIAESYGIRTCRIEKYSNMDQAIREMIEYQGPYLLEVMVEREENVFPMIPAGVSLDGIIMKTIHK